MGERGERKRENEKAVRMRGMVQRRCRAGGRDDRIGSFLYKRSSVITSRRSPSDFVPRNIQLYNNLKAKAGAGPDRISFLPRPIRRRVSSASSFISYLECRFFFRDHRQCRAACSPIPQSCARNETR